jgi:hypothetical protein
MKTYFTTTGIKPHHIAVSHVVDHEDGMTAPCRVILGHSHKEGEYVTRIQNMQTGGEDHGEYFDTFEQAVTEFVQRGRGYGVDVTPESFNVRGYTTQALKERSHRVGSEWISDKDLVCIRPMHFDTDGLRVVRHAPDPCEFMLFEKAVQQLERLEAAANYASEHTKLP